METTPNSAEREARTIYELTESERNAAEAAFSAAHGSGPDLRTPSDRAWLEGYAAARSSVGERAEPITDAEAHAIHSLPYVRDCLLAYHESPEDATADEVVKAIAVQVAALSARVTRGQPTQESEQREDMNPIKDGWQLSYCPNGHSGPGVYAHMTEYPEEGAILLQPTPPAPAPQVQTVMDAYLRSLLEDWVSSFADSIEGGEADELVKATRAALSIPAPEARGAVQWPTMPPSRGQSHVLFDDGYTEGWSACLAACKAALASSAQAGAGEIKPLTDEMLNFIIWSNWGYGRDNFVAVARAVEAHHGIGKAAAKGEEQP